MQAAKLTSQMRRSRRSRLRKEVKSRAPGLTCRSRRFLSEGCRRSLACAGALRGTFSKTKIASVPR